jgi:hypothetical protein
VGGNTLPTVTQKDIAKYILENFNYSSFQFMCSNDGMGLIISTMTLSIKHKIIYIHDKIWEKYFKSHS